MCTLTRDILHCEPSVDDYPHQCVDGHLREEVEGLHEEKGDGPEGDETYDDGQELKTSELHPALLLVKLLLQALHCLTPACLLQTKGTRNVYNVLRVLVIIWSNSKLCTLIQTDMAVQLVVAASKGSRPTWLPDDVRIERVFQTV